MKQIIKLNESELHNIIKESVVRILNEFHQSGINTKDVINIAKQIHSENPNIDEYQLTNMVISELGIDCTDNDVWDEVLNIIVCNENE